MYVLAAMRAWLCAAVVLGVFGSVLAWGTPPHDSVRREAAAITALGAAAVLASLGLTLTPALAGKSGVRLRVAARSVAPYLSFPLFLKGIPLLGLPPLGMIVAVYAFTWLEASAAGGVPAARALGLASLMALVCYLLFPVLLGWQVQVWPTFLVEVDKQHLLMPFRATTTAC